MLVVKLDPDTISAGTVVEHVYSVKEYLDKYRNPVYIKPGYRLWDGDAPVGTHVELRELKEWFDKLSPESQQFELSTSGH